MDCVYDYLQSLVNPVGMFYLFKPRMSELRCFVFVILHFVRLVWTPFHKNVGCLAAQFINYLDNELCVLNQLYCIFVRLLN